MFTFVGPERILTAPAPGAPVVPNAAQKRSAEMASKLVTDREKSTRAVRAAVDTHCEAIATTLEKVLSPHLRKGEKMPDTALLARLVGRSLGADNEALARADKAHEAELADDAAPRTKRDTSAEKGAIGAGGRARRRSATGSPDTCSSTRS
ncbi:MAG: hypothetical protein EXR72_24960 [Myxococcales bacterium]|nr:hypothetical protein [Myxococcales bacterium]